MKNIILLFIFTILLSFLGFIALKVIDANLPAIQFFLNPTHKPTPAEELMLKRARRNPSPSDFKSLYEDVVKVARPTPYIEIGRCSPYPLVARIIVNTNVTFRNSDTKLHTLTFTPKVSISLRPGEKKSILMNFYKYIPIPYGYTCDNSPTPIGILFMVEK